MIFLLAELSPELVDAAVLGNTFPTTAAATAKAATVETRKNPLRSIATLLLRRDPYKNRKYVSHKIV